MSKRKIRATGPSESPAELDEPVDDGVGHEQRASAVDDRTDTEGPAGNGGTGEADEAAAGGESLEEQLAAARAEAAEHQDRCLRTQAELQNVLKRHERDRGDRLKYAGEPLGRDLLAVVDDLERALEHTDGADDGLVEGVKMVRSALLAVLERHGIERLETVGKAFDPNEHEAVATVETEEYPPNTVVDEHRAGYRIHDRLLRAAMVVVSKSPADGDK